MKNEEMEKLGNTTLAAYIQKATALIGKSRRVGGNQFRHAMATLAILIDYKITDPILLKASVIHDLFEDVPETKPEEIEKIDEDGKQVVKLVWEVTRREEPKTTYLQRVVDTGSRKAKLLKVADRISNITDLHRSIFTEEFIRRYLDETEKYICPIASQVNKHMATELNDLLDVRRKSLSQTSPSGATD